MRSLAIAALRLGVMFVALVVAPLVALVAKPEWRAKAVEYSGNWGQNWLGSASKSGEEAEPLQLVELPNATRSAPRTDAGLDPAWPATSQTENASSAYPDHSLDVESGAARSNGAPNSFDSGAPKDQPPQTPERYSPVASAPGRSRTNAVAAPPAVPVNERMSRLEQRFKDLGASYFVLRRVAGTAPFLFECRMPDQAGGEQTFQATATTGLRAMEDVLYELERNVRLAELPADSKFR